MEKKTACGDLVTKLSPVTTYNGKSVYFCEEKCKEEFLENPVKFLKSDHFLINFELLEDA